MTGQIYLYAIFPVILAVAAFLILCVILYFEPPILIRLRDWKKKLRARKERERWQQDFGACISHAASAFAAGKNLREVFEGLEHMKSVSEPMRQVFRDLYHHLKEGDVPSNEAWSAFASELDVMEAYTLASRMGNTTSLERNEYNTFSAVSELFLERRYLEKKKVKNLDEQFAQSCMLLSAALGSGKALPGALKEVALNWTIHPVLRNAYSELAAKLDTGIALETGFQDFVKQVGTPDAYDLAISVTMQDKSGGKMADTVASLAANISKRVEQRAKVESALAGIVSTNRMLGGITFLGLLGGALLMRDNRTFYFSDPSHLVILLICLVLTRVGHALIGRMINDIRKEI